MKPEELKNMLDSLAEIKADLKDLKSLVIGSDYHENPLIDRVKELEASNEKLNKKLWMISGALITLQVIFSGLLIYLKITK